MRQLERPRSVQRWSLTTLREKLTKIGAKVVRHPRYATSQMAEVALPRHLFAAIPHRMQQFGVPPPFPRQSMFDKIEVDVIAVAKPVCLVAYAVFPIRIRSELL